MAYWLLKTEPQAYSMADLEREQRTAWDGVRNATASRNMRQMQPGDQCFIYHTGTERAVVGVAQVVGAPYPDPSAADGRSIAVTVAPVRRLRRPVTLAEIKADPAAADWELVRISRLSVMPVPPDLWQRVLAMAGEGQ